jgi:hypothetical protein
MHGRLPLLFAFCYAGTASGDVSYSVLAGQVNISGRGQSSDNICSRTSAADLAACRRRHAEYTGHRPLNARCSALGVESTMTVRRGVSLIVVCGALFVRWPDHGRSVDTTASTMTVGCFCEQRQMRSDSDFEGLRQ